MHKIKRSAFKRVKTSVGNFITDRLIDLPFFHLAYLKYDTMWYIRDIQIRIVHNFIICEIYPHAPEVELWWMEINYWIHLINRKLNRCKLTDTVIFGIMFNEPIEAVEELECHIIRITKIRAGMNLTPVSINSETLHRRLKSIIGKICVSLAKREYTTLSDFYVPSPIKAIIKVDDEQFNKRLKLLLESLDHVDSTRN